MALTTAFKGTASILRGVGRSRPNNATDTAKMSVTSLNVNWFTLYEIFYDKPPLIDPVFLSGTIDYMKKTVQKQKAGTTPKTNVMPDIAPARPSSSLKVV